MELLEGLSGHLEFGKDPIVSRSSRTKTYISPSSQLQAPNRTEAQDSGETANSDSRSTACSSVSEQILQLARVAAKHTARIRSINQSNYRALSKKNQKFELYNKLEQATDELW